MDNILFSIHKLLPSERKSVKLIEPLILELRNQLIFSDALYYNILIASTEAINNAIIHGNKCLCDKQVTLDIKANYSQIQIEIKDQGCGFEAEELADPRDPNNLMKTGGRGVFLIKELSDYSDFKSDEFGSIIKMMFNIK